MKDLHCMLNCIKVAIISKQKIASFYPKNKTLCLKMARLLYNEGFILSYVYNKKINNLIIYINYYKGQSVIGGITSFNKSSFPVYIKYTDIISIQKFGIAVLILSTVKGFLPHYQALKYKLGGQAICLLH